MNLDRSVSSLLALCLVVSGAFVVSGCSPFAKTDDKKKASADDVIDVKETQADLKDRLARLKIKRDDIRRAKVRLVKRKQAIVSELGELGIKSPADYKNSMDDRVKLAVARLRSAATKVEHLDSTEIQFDRAIARVEAKREEMEFLILTEKAGVTRDQMVELTAMILDIDEQLGVNADEEDISEELAIEELLTLELEDNPEDSLSSETLIDPAK